MAEAGSQHSTGRVPELSPDELMREQRLQRNLKIVIAALSLMIVGGLAAIIIRIVTMPPTSPATGLASGAAAGAPTGTAPATPLFGAIGQPIGDIALELPAGAKIVSVSVAGSRLAVHYEGTTGAGIAVIDLDTGRRIANVKQSSAPPR